jgi:hypothetical protein
MNEGKGEGLDVTRRVDKGQGERFPSKVSKGVAYFLGVFGTNDCSDVLLSWDNWTAPSPFFFLGNESTKPSGRSHVEGRKVI